LLEEELGVSVIPTVAVRRKGLEELAEAIASASSREPGPGQTTFDHLVLDLFANNLEERAVYAIDPKEPWAERFEFVELVGGNLYQVQPRSLPEP
jgi:Fe2+ transport system protein B